MKKLWLIVIGVGLLTGAALVIVALVGGENGAGAERIDQVNETLGTSEPEGVPTPENSPTADSPVGQSFEYGIKFGDVNAFLSESQEAFLARPIEERVLVSLYFAQELPEFAEDWYSVTKNPLDVLPEEISIDNTPQEIVTIASYLNRLPYTLKMPDDYTLDVNAANKLFAANLLDGADSLRYEIAISAVQDFANAGGSGPSARTLAVSDYIPMAVVQDASELLEDNRGYRYRTIEFTELGTTTLLTFYWVTTASGQGIWVRP